MHAEPVVDSHLEWKDLAERVFDNEQVYYNYYIFLITVNIINVHIFIMYCFSYVILAIV